MSVNTLSTVSKNIVGHYQHAGEHVTGTWRAGTKRAIGAAHRRAADLVRRAWVPLVGAGIKDAWIDAQAQLADLLSAGLALPAARTGIVIDRIAETVNRRIDRAADAAARIDSAVAAPALDTASKMALPAAHFSLAVAGALDQGAGRLRERVGAGVEVADAVAIAARPARRHRASRKG